MTDLFHLVEEATWADAALSAETYYPPTYEQDGFVHATADAALTLKVANHFYRASTAKWKCLRISLAALSASGVEVKFEPPASVGQASGEFDGATDVSFPHIYGGIGPSAVLEVHNLTRAEDGTFMSISEYD